MASTYYVRERRFNGSDYDTLYPTLTPTDGMVKTQDGKSTVAVEGVDYQGTVTAGKNIKIEGNVISAKGGMFPKIVVTAPIGSTVTITKGVVTKTATEEEGKWTFDVPSFGVWTVNAIRGTKSASGVVEVDNVRVYNLSLTYQSIYGVHWDGTASTALTRTDDSALFPEPNPYYVGMTDTPSSPFDNLYPWSGMVRVTDAEAGELVAIPKFWFKLDINSDQSMDIQIADSPVEGFSISPMHSDRGDGKGERDIAYIGRYHCNNSNYKSTTESLPMHQILLEELNSNIHALGNTIWQNDIHTRITVWLLYLVEFADWNSQNRIGYGCSTNGSLMEMGYTDYMPYHTGTITSARDTFGTYGGTQYRYIEGLWDNVYDAIEGIYFNRTKIYIINNPASFDQLSEMVYIGNVYEHSGTIESWQKGSGDYNWFIYPLTTADYGGADRYICDNIETYEREALICGGDYSKEWSNGLFSLRDASWGYQRSGIGSRLMKLP